MCVCVCVRAHACACSVVSDSEPLWTAAHQAPLPMEFSQREYWSGVLCPPPGDLPNPGIEIVSPALAGGFFTTGPPGKPFDTPSHGKCHDLPCFASWSVFSDCRFFGQLNSQILIHTSTFFFSVWPCYYLLKYQDEKSPFLSIIDKWLQLNLGPFASDLN